MKFYFLILTICLISSSCKKETKESIWECDSAQFLDSTAISNKITGSWLWTKQLCGDGAGKILSANKNVNVTFNLNRTFTLVENTTIIIQGSWNLKMVDNNLWGLDLNSSNEYLYGRILFCNNQIMFNSSYLDGCDNVFAKQ